MTKPRTSSHRAGPLFGAVLVLVTGALAFTPAVPPAAGVDPTPAPSYALLTLRKSVDNTGGGTAAASDWVLSATGATTIAGRTGDPAVTDAQVDPDTYVLAESGGPAGYDAGAWTCTGGTLTANRLAMAAGDVATCSITNTFIPPDPTPAPTPDPTPDPTPAPTPDPTPDPTPAPTPEPTPQPTPDPWLVPTPEPTPTPEVRANLAMSVSAPAAGRRRVDPGALVTIQLVGHVRGPAKEVRLVAEVPPGWGVADAGGGTVDRSSATVTWDLGNVTDDAVPALLQLLAPVFSPTGRPAFDVILASRLEHAGGIADTASVKIRVAPELVVQHVTLARIDSANHEAVYLPSDVALDGIDRYDSFRVSFQVRNADLVPAALVPQLQYRSAGMPVFSDVPVGKGESGVPFYIGTEWRRVPSGGTLPGPKVEGIAAFELHQHDRDDDTQEPTAGRRLMGEDAGGFALRGDSYSEIEFTLKVTGDLPFGQGFELRLVDNGRELPGTTTAGVRSADRPRLDLSPGQRDGVPVGPPVDARPAAINQVDSPALVPASWAATGLAPSSGPTYRLAVAVPTTPVVEYPLNAPFTSPHVPDNSLVSDTCAVCHRAHVAQNGNLLAEPPTQATMCFTCHDGAGSNLDIKKQYTDVAVPANNPGSPGLLRSAYYRHDALDASVPISHTQAANDEFGGVLNRHAECSDCHNSHNAAATPSVQFSDGWSVSGRQAALSGVSVVNGDPGQAPAYTFLSGAAGAQPDREYQICFKCHSGFTTLPSPDAAFPSTWALDKGIELNPGNASYHPVEAKGKNTSDQIKWNLANSSPYKQWNFTVDSTVRCVNCHGDPAKWNASLPELGTDETAAGAALAPHTSQYRGLLIQNYRDRVLKSPTEPYAAADFALCYVCHAEASFILSNRTNTAFRAHDNHLWAMQDEGPGGTDIDTPGQGGGNAICAECHFRTHSTAQAYNAGDRSNERLVNFAPNVEPLDGVLQFTKTATGGSCTLVCHGKLHENETYGP